MLSKEFTSLYLRYNIYIFVLLASYFDLIWNILKHKICHFLLDIDIITFYFIFQTKWNFLFDFYWVFESNLMVWNFFLIIKVNEKIGRYHWKILDECFNEILEMAFTKYIYSSTTEFSLKKKS